MGGTCGCLLLLLRGVEASPNRLQGLQTPDTSAALAVTHVKSESFLCMRVRPRAVGAKGQYIGLNAKLSVRILVWKDFVGRLGGTATPSSQTMRAAIIMIQSCFDFSSFLNIYACSQSVCQSLSILIYVHLPTRPPPPSKISLLAIRLSVFAHPQTYTFPQSSPSPSAYTRRACHNKGSNTSVLPSKISNSRCSKCKGIPFLFPFHTSNTLLIFLNLVTIAAPGVQSIPSSPSSPHPSNLPTKRAKSKPSENSGQSWWCDDEKRRRSGCCKITPWVSSQWSRSSASAPPR